MPNSDIEPTEITDAIKRIRTRQGISQKQLAERLGVSPATMNKIENGGGNIETRTLFRIAGALGVEPAELLGSYSEEFLSMWERFRALPEHRRAKVIEHVIDQEALSSLEPPNDNQ